MYNVSSMKAEEFISDEEIRETLSFADANKDNVELIDSIIAKAKERKGLNHIIQPHFLKILIFFYLFPRTFISLSSSPHQNPPPQRLHPFSSLLPQLSFLFISFLIFNPSLVQTTTALCGSKMCVCSSLFSPESTLLRGNYMYVMVVVGKL